nr:unnamed protein product [Callosobruchus chinensis]
MSDVASVQLELPKKTRLRFREEDDLIFLREVLGYNPFQQPELWSVIQEHVYAATRKSFSVKTLKDHLDLLIKIWIEKTKNYKDQSGIEEEYCEKDKLPQEVYDLMTEYRIKKKQTETSRYCCTRLLG